MARPSHLIRHTNCGSTNPSRFVIGTFSVRGFNSATKRDQLSDDLGRIHFEICCMQETKFPAGFDQRSGNYRKLSAHRVTFTITALWPCLLRIYAVRKPNRSLLVGIGQNCRDSIAPIKQLHTYYNQRVLPDIAGDFNSKIGYRKYDKNFMEHHSRGRRNINRIALADFLEVHGLFICNTAFQHSAQHTTTWQGQRRDVTTYQVVPIYMYNVIDVEICHQTRPHYDIVSSKWTPRERPPAACFADRSSRKAMMTRMERW